MAQTVDKFQIIQKVSETETVILHPETEADIVKIDPEAAGVQANNVQGAVKEVVQKVTQLLDDVVTGVKGGAESTYRKGQVNLTPANIGAEPSGTVSTHNTNGSAHSDIRKAVSNAQSRADEAYTLAEGRAKAVAFDTVAAMTTALKAAAKTDFKVGDNIYIKATDVPDYWVSAVLSTNTGTYGYFELSVLESQKVDISGYQTKNDSGLNTTQKTVVGAINEVKSTADGAKSKSDSNETKIADIVSGTTKVGKAAQADAATSASSAAKWTNARKISVKVHSGASNSGSDIYGSAEESVDGSADKTIDVTLGNSGVGEGTYSAVKVNAQGIAVAGGQMIEIGVVGQEEASSALATGGLFFKRIL